jgi:hypothetical protein
MNRRFAYPLVACLALAAGPHDAISASSVPDPVPNVEILVDGVAQRRYAHDGRWYVEALKGREYAIRLRNPYGVRVAVALSVDGLNTIDARETTAAAARKWVLDPYETVTISGWQTSQTHARRFEFTTEERSYGQALGKTANLGVISAVFFKERVSTLMSESTSARSRSLPAAGPRPSESDARQGNAAAQPLGQAKRADNEYAATGMGRATGHAVTQVQMDLEDAAAHTVNIRYEFRPQLVRLGILPRVVAADPLQRRERAQGFEQGFCPEPPRHR